MLKEILVFLAGYSVGRSKSSLGRLFILGCAAYALIAIYIGVIFFLGIICTGVKFLSSLSLAVIRLLYKRVHKT